MTIAISYCCSRGRIWSRIFNLWVMSIIFWMDCHLNRVRWRWCAWSKASCSMVSSSGIWGCKFHRGEVDQLYFSRISRHIRFWRNLPSKSSILLFSWVTRWTMSKTIWTSISRSKGANSRRSRSAISIWADTYKIKSNRPNIISNSKMQLKMVKTMNSGAPAQHFQKFRASFFPMSPH